MHHEVSEPRTLGASMKHRFSLQLAALTLASALSAGALHAQANPIHFNIAAGAAIPTGDLGNFTDVGYNITAGLGVKAPTTPFGFRAEGFFNQLNFSNDVFGGD